MSEYNIQMNKYNALNAGYDQLYPATKIENVDGLDTALQKKADASSVYTKTESDTLLQKKADASSVYTKEESISAETRTALSLSETATPDAALAEIARQLSEKAVRYDFPLASGLDTDRGIYYCKDSSGIVHFYGNICTPMGASISDDQTLGTLPAGFRPLDSTVAPISASSMTAKAFGNDAHITIYSDGRVVSKTAVPSKGTNYRAYIWVSASFVAGN